MTSEQAWSTPRPRVHSVAIELTAFCNQRCDYCYNAWRDDGGASIGTPELATVLARINRVLDAVEVEHVTITGGEPLASHDLFPVLDHLRARHIPMQMISNGALVTAPIALRLSRYRLRSVLVTLNGPDAALHDAQVGGDFFEATIRGIALLRQARVKVEGSIVITHRNADRVGETLERFASLGVSRVALSRFSAAGYAMERREELVPTRADIVRALEAATSFARRSTQAVSLFSTMPIPPCAIERARFPEIDFHDCPIGTAGQEFVLGPRGELRHCPLHRDPILPSANDVLDDALDIAHLLSPGDPHRYRAALPTYCQECEHASTCNGGCGAAARWVAGDHGMAQRGVDPFVSPDVLAKKRLPLFG